MRSPILFILVAGCTSRSGKSPPDSVDLQVNDLSVLLPLPQTQAGLDAMLTPMSPALGGALLPEATFAAAQVSIDYTQLHAVAFRFDPCFGQLGAITDPSTCNNQLRVVFQPVFAGIDGGIATTADQAVHAFYSITRDQLIEAVDEMVAAREGDGIDYDLGPLAPHPIIATEGLDGALAQKLLAIVTRYAGGSELARMTAFEVEEIADGSQPIIGDGEFWELQSFDVAAGAVTPRSIATIPGDVNTMSLSAGVNPLESSGSPATTSADNIAVLESMTTASAATTTARQTAFDAALRVLNPHDNSPDTIDCASCHLAQPALTMVGEPLGMTATGDSAAFVADPSIPLADLAQTTQLVSSGVLNIHAFSYRDSDPMINQRVINETAANLAYLETLLR
jgi:hypothetical protein